MTVDDFKGWLRAEWDRVAGYALIVLGAVALFLGFNGVSDSPFVAEELAYISSGGLGGLFLLGVGATLVLRAELHDQWRKLDAVESAIRAQAKGEPGGPESNGASPPLTALPQRRRSPLRAR